MKERPILFSAMMVRAILDGRKAQTRRVIDRMTGFRQARQFDRSNTPGYDWHFRCQRGLWQDMRNNEVLNRCPYGKPGDRLWVRESWAVSNIYDKTAPSKICVDLPKGPGRQPTKVLYPATDSISDCIRRRPSIHMPRWASRITLEITSVRAERLNDISEADSVAEGIHKFHGLELYGHDPKGTPGPMVGGTAVESFFHLWQSINGPDSWAANPWVWVVKFKRIDQ